MPAAPSGPLGPHRGGLATPTPPPTEGPRTVIPLVLLRHGESTWNRDDRFTGWTDVPLSERGVEQARSAGRALAEAGYAFDVAFTSVLKRAIKTLWLALEEADQMWIPVERSWRLNERHYGALQGLSKHETIEREGKEQVHRWRRSWNVQPPLLTADDERHAGRDRRYAELAPGQVPLGESLADTTHRMLPYWDEAIAPALRAGRRPLVAAHGNSLRALVKHLDGIADDEIPKVEIPVGRPLVYELSADLAPERSFYLDEG